MPTVFVSHVADDADVAGQIAAAIRAHGNAVSRPMRDAAGDGARVAIDRSDVVVLVISPASFGSEQMTEEIEASAKGGKAFVPVLISLSHAEFADRAPEWQAAIGAASSVAVPPAGVESVLPRILEGVAALTAPRPSPPAGIGTRARPRALVGAVLAVVLVGAGTAWLVSSGGGETSSDGGPRDGFVTTTFEPGPLADAATTPLTTSIGELQITDARLTSKVCGTSSDECATASGSERFVLLTLSDADGREVTFTEDFRKDLSSSYVELGDHRASYTDATQDFFLSTARGSFRIAYKFLPASAAGGDARLVWPGSPTLRLDLR